MKNQFRKTYFWQTVLLSVLGLVFFVGCSDEIPDEAAEEVAAETVMVPIETVLAVVAHENEVARTLYTGQVVGPGIKAGIAFHEDWQDADVFAGPLPALFLRGASTSLSKSPVPLGLFLGSDFPISNANAFTDVQMEKFELIRADGEPQFFYDEELALNTAMFKDVAVAEACVTCHNEHPESDKADWAMGDIMGATTWTYPKDEVTVAEFYEIIDAYRLGVEDAYNSFMSEIEDWDAKPEIGAVWPGEESFTVPSTEVFMAKFEELASAETLSTVFEVTQ